MDLPYFPHYLKNGAFSGGRGIIEHKIMCVLIFSTTFSETFFILRRIQSDIITNVHRSACKVPIILSDFNETGIFSTDFQKNAQISNFMQIHPMGAELFHADGQTIRRS